MWVKMKNGKIPERAVAGGMDAGGMVYVGRAEHKGDILPGKIHPHHGLCFVPWGGDEHEKSSYEALTVPQGSEYDWVESSKGKVPKGAIHGGQTTNGEKLYIARTYHKDCRVIGKVHPSHHTCYIPYGGKEFAKEEYEVLIDKKKSIMILRSSAREKAMWVTMKGGKIPEHAVAAGKDAGNTIYVGRAVHEGDILPGKIHTQYGLCYVPWGGDEHEKSSYEALAVPQGFEYDWVKASKGKVPKGAIQGGRTVDGEKLYIARTHHMGCSVIGKVHPSHRVCYIPYGGKEFAKQQYEVLIDKKKPSY